MPRDTGMVSFVSVGGALSIFVCTAVICLSPLFLPAIGHLGSTPINRGSTNDAEFRTNRVRGRCNLVLEAAETHLTIVINNQQQGSQQVKSNER